MVLKQSYNIIITKKLWTWKKYVFYVWIFYNTATLFYYRYFVIKIDLLTVVLNNVLFLYVNKCVEFA